MPLPSAGLCPGAGIQWLFGSRESIQGAPAVALMDEGNQAGTASSWLSELDRDRGCSLSSPQPPRGAHYLYR